jgi:hypothetical protein
MPRFLASLLLAISLAGAASPTLAQSSADPSQPLNCDRGPIRKSFGGAPWLAYACSDGRSVVLMSAPESPANPFYFMFSAKGSAHQLIGEGTGSKVVTDKAYAELSALSEPQIQRLFAEAAKVPPQK